MAADGGTSVFRVLPSVSVHWDCDSLVGVRGSTGKNTDSPLEVVIGITLAGGFSRTDSCCKNALGSRALNLRVFKVVPKNKSKTYREGYDTLKISAENFRDESICVSSARLTSFFNHGPPNHAGSCLDRLGPPLNKRESASGLMETL